MNKHTIIIFKNKFCLFTFQHGASLKRYDKEDLTPLDLLMKDKPVYVTFDPNNPTQAYTWGSNSNFNLGHGRQRSREQPELVDSLVLGNHSIKQVSLIRQYIFESTYWIYHGSTHESHNWPQNQENTIRKIVVLLLKRKIDVHYFTRNFRTKYDIVILTQVVSFGLYEGKILIELKMDHFLKNLASHAYMQQWIS